MSNQKESIESSGKKSQGVWTKSAAHDGSKANLTFNLKDINLEQAQFINKVEIDNQAMQSNSYRESPKK